MGHALAQDQYFSQFRSSLVFGRLTTHIRHCYLKYEKKSRITVSVSGTSYCNPQGSGLINLKRCMLRGPPKAAIHLFVGSL